MYASGRTTQTTMSEDVSVNKAFAKDEGETQELEEFTGKHLIETGDRGPDALTNQIGWDPHYTTTDTTSLPDGGR